MAMTGKVAACHTHQCRGLCGGVPVSPASRNAVVRLKARHGCAALRFMQSERHAFVRARSVSLAAVQEEAAVAAAPAETAHRTEDSQSAADVASVHHDREQEASSSGREDAGGESEASGQGAASGSGPALSTAAQGGGRGGRGGRPRVGQPIGKRDVTGRLRHGRPQGMKERCTEPFFQLGDTVAARIIWANERGARAELLQETRLVGYLPVREMPYIVRKCAGASSESGHWTAGPCLPVGLVREYEVVAVPDELEYHGRGPMLSARRVDLNRLWRRAEQLLETSIEDREVFKVKITEANTGGLLTTIESLPAFIPYSHVPKPPSQKFTPQEMSAEYKDKEVIVSVAEVNPLHRKLMLSIINGQHNLQMRKIHVGALVWGSVRRIENFGLFLGLDNLKMSALLHISNMSRAHVQDANALFEEGDRVRALVVGMNPDCTRISLSTAELEVEDGDMLKDKEKVYSTAEAQQKLFMEHISQVEEENGPLDW